MTSTTVNRDGSPKKPRRSRATYTEPDDDWTDGRYRFYEPARSAAVERVRNGETRRAVAEFYGVQRATIARAVAEADRIDAGGALPAPSPPRNTRPPHRPDIVPRPVTDADRERAWLLEQLRLRPRWHRDAACREYPELSWFPSRGEDTQRQKAVCAACLVRSECAAAGADDHYGIWGAMSERGRRSLRVTAVTAA